MDVLVLIDKLDDLVHNAKAVPLTDQVRIDREEIYDILDQMRATIPEEIKQARWIVKERQEMLAEAKRECDRLIGEAREQAMREASQTEIVKIAERQAQDIVEEARRQARETRLEMEDWADGILSTLEVNLDKFLVAVRRGRERLHERSQETVVAGIGPIDRDGAAAGRRELPVAPGCVAGPLRAGGSLRGVRLSRSRRDLDEPVAGDAAEPGSPWRYALTKNCTAVRGPELREVALGGRRSAEPAVLPVAGPARSASRAASSEEDERVADDEAACVLHLDPDGERRRARPNRARRKVRLVDDQALFDGTLVTGIDFSPFGSVTVGWPGPAGPARPRALGGGDGLGLAARGCGRPVHPGADGLADVPVPEHVKRDRHREAGLQDAVVSHSVAAEPLERERDR